MKKHYFLFVNTVLAACIFVSFNTYAAELSGFDGKKLKRILDQQPTDVKARYVYRHPYETLEFIGIEPGQTVLEALPGGGWYSNILRPYLGKQGKLIGVDYDYGMWSHFSWVDKGFLKKRKKWFSEWVQKTQSKGDKDVAEQMGYTFATLPDKLTGKVDTVLFIRALHNLARFNKQGGYLDTALAEAYRVLKPGGTLAVVQHQVADSHSADGSSGYVTQALVRSALEKAGFIFVAESSVNENALDKPSASDIVWRLPPSYSTSKGNAALRQAMQKIGESNRMTLRFTKPLNESSAPAVTAP